MALGFGFGPLLRCRPDVRRLWCIRLGLAFLSLFVILRIANGYGDPHPWTVQRNAVFTLLSFVNCTKYPPSLLYLLMTLGAALLLLGWFERIPRCVGTWLSVFGRVPLFYYLVHLYLIHGLAMMIVWLSGGPVGPVLASPFTPGRPPDYGYSLISVYGLWGLVIAALYPLCYWLSELKRRRRVWWSSYL
jgi:uncharacterized membrane protein